MTHAITYTHSEPAEPTLRQRLYALLDAALAFNSNVVLFEAQYGGELATDVIAWAEAHELMVDPMLGAYGFDIRAPMPRTIVVTVYFRSAQEAA